MNKGGSTMPWKIIVIDQLQVPIVEVPFVLKLFTPRSVEQQHPIGKEFFCNSLAGEFDLVAPDAGLVMLDETFISILPDKLKSEYNRKRHPGFNFASRLCDSALLLDEGIAKTAVSIQEAANVFAFDCLIQNLDRGGMRNKPNLLIDDDGLILIDHEQSFPFIDNDNPGPYLAFQQAFEGNTLLYPYERHQFYPRLKYYRGPKKISLFDEFEELLRRMNMRHIEELIGEIEGKGISIGLSDVLIEYLWFIKQNSEKFRNILLGLIS